MSGDWYRGPKKRTAVRGSFVNLLKRAGYFRGNYVGQGLRA